MRLGYDARSVFAGSHKPRKATRPRSTAKQGLRDFGEVDATATPESHITAENHRKLG